MTTHIFAPVSDDNENRKSSPQSPFKM